MMSRFILKTFLLFFSLLFTTKVYAQLPNEKFGKPSSMEWEYIGWREALDADALILYKTMKATYQLSDQVENFNQSSSEIGAGNFTDFSKNQIDQSNILVKYEFRLRTKILKPEGAKHANIDITYYDTDNGMSDNNDELSDLNIKVFYKNEKGKVEKRNVKTNDFVKERVDSNYVVMHVEVPDVQAGNIIEYQYNITSIRPTFLYDWVYQECIPTVRSSCDIDIPAFLLFNMNAPINKYMKSSVEAGHLAYDANRPDLKKGKSCPTNHYKIIGEYILPENMTEEKIAIFTSRITTPNMNIPAYMPKGSTHLKLK